MCKIEAESAAADIHSNQILTCCFINDREEYDTVKTAAKKRGVVFYQYVLFKSKYTLLVTDYKLRGYNSINVWLTNRKPLLLCICLCIWEREAPSVSPCHIPQKTDDLQPASQQLSSSEIKPQKSIVKSEQRREKDAQSIRFEPVIQSAVTAVYSPVTVSHFSSLDPSLPHFPLSLFLFFSVCLFIPPLTLSSSILSLACSWTEWASTALRNPVSMAVWASKQVSRIL